MKHFKIFYNDSVYAETISFDNKDNNFINQYLQNRIKEYNQNTNKLYHIGFDNIKEV